MKIILNNIQEEIQTNKEKITVSELLTLKKFTFKLLVVKINGNTIKKENYDTTFIKEGDNVQVIHLMSGG